jgi:hypothetical protein
LDLLSDILVSKFAFKINLCRYSQVFLYKRAQIFTGDVWGRFEGKGLGDFGDSIGELTMFADYRVPVVGAVQVECS